MVNSFHLCDVHEEDCEDIRIKYQSLKQDERDNRL